MSKNRRYFSLIQTGLRRHLYPAFFRTSLFWLLVPISGLAWADVQRLGPAVLVLDQMEKEYDGGRGDQKISDLIEIYTLLSRCDEIYHLVHKIRKAHVGGASSLEFIEICSSLDKTNIFDREISRKEKCSNSQNKIESDLKKIECFRQTLLEHQKDSNTVFKAYQAKKNIPEVRYIFMKWLEHFGSKFMRDSKLKRIYLELNREFILSD